MPQKTVGGVVGRLLTGPAAFFVATLVDLAIYLVGRAPRRLRSRG